MGALKELPEVTVSERKSTSLRVRPSVFSLMTAALYLSPTFKGSAKSSLMTLISDQSPLLFEVQFALKRVASPIIF